MPLLPQITPPVEPHVLGQAARVYNCQCGQAIFFSNSTCLACGVALGYHPEQARLLPLQEGPEPGSWLTEPASEGSLYRRCANLHSPAACNWLLLAAESAAQDDLCRACRLNRIIPDLSDPLQPENGELWGRVELAKRRLVSALLVLGLPVASRQTEDPERGLMFDVMRAADADSHVMTGHNSGLITLNLMEADHVERETTRKAMHEPYRTLVGHLRHEVGHYYWDRLVAGTPWITNCRVLFGDENQDYAACLEKNYTDGPRPDWPLHFISAYASVHPWEDWAECWAHYLHMRDTVDTAVSYGLSINSSQLEFTPFELDVLYLPEHRSAPHFLAFLNHWTQLTMLLNGMSRAMGQPDFYPFVLAHDVVAKLHFIHLVVSAVSQPVRAPRQRQRRLRSRQRLAQAA